MPEAETTTTAPPRTSGRLGTFAGVFTPSILTILGIILFLRLGYVVGSAGLGRALLMILIANAISVLTSISLATIATNLRVRKGGDYYLISRTLGVEFGGALGLVLYLAQSVSIAFYAIGFGEAVTNMIPNAPAILPQLIAGVAIASLFVLAWLGADAATRFQYVVMAILALALLMFFWGAITKFDPSYVRANWGSIDEQQLTAIWEGQGEQPDIDFWVIFAIFFPAVTGFTQGVSMSGDLKDPARSLPLGTFLAVGVSMLVYFAAAVLFAGSALRGTMINDFGAMREVSLFRWFIDAGVIAATLSSALASYLGAPRILQSLAQDRVFPFLNFFAKGSGPDQTNPRRGVLLSTAIAFAVIAKGDLNIIAPIVSMFFLISYGLINYATYVEATSNSPSFRPTFRWFHPRLSFVGFVACGAVMLAIEPVAAAVAVAILFGIHVYIEYTVDVERWADSNRSSLLQRIRHSLLRLTSETENLRDWRPCIVAFSNDEGRRERLVRFASWLEGGSGFTTAVRILEGRGAETRKKGRESEDALNKEIVQKKMPAFGRVIVARDLETSIPVILQAHGLGNIRANTVIVNWFDREENVDSPGLKLYGHYLRIALRYHCHVIILSISDEELAELAETRKKDRSIDVWYQDDSTGHVMLLLAYLMTRSEDWGQAKLRLLIRRSEDQSAEDAMQAAQKMLQDIRIEAEPLVIEPYDRDSVMKVSRDTSVVFMPFKLRDETPLGPFEGSLDELVRRLKITAMVRAASDIELDPDPEKSLQGLIAAAMDRATRRAEAVKNVERDVVAIGKEIDGLKEKLAEAQKNGDTPAEEIEELQADMEKSRLRLEEVQRKLARDRAAAEAAQKEADELREKEQPAPKPADG